MHQRKKKCMFWVNALMGYDRINANNKWTFILHLPRLISWLLRDFKVIWAITPFFFSQISNIGSHGHHAIDLVDRRRIEKNDIAKGECYNQSTARCDYNHLCSFLFSFAVSFAKVISDDVCHEQKNTCH